MQFSATYERSPRSQLTVTAVISLFVLPHCADRSQETASPGPR
jgi:hypothetical protein